MVFLSSKFVNFKMTFGHKNLHYTTVFVCFVSFSKIRSIQHLLLNNKGPTFAVDTSIQNVLKKNVNCTLIQALRLCKAVRPMGGVEVQLYPFMTMALEGGERSASRPGRSLPAGKSRYPLYRRQGGLQGRSGQVRKISLHRDSIPGPSSPQPVLIRITLRGLLDYVYCGVNAELSNSNYISAWLE